MAGKAPPNKAQTETWNGVGGRTWADLHAPLDQLFQPFETLLVDIAVAADGKHALDVGCGAGSTTLALARALGPSSRCMGLDISEPLVATAAARAAAEQANNVTFIKADAQTYLFTPNSFDTVMSRLGVMFFDDPEAAFANLRRAARSGAKLAFVAWRGRNENPFMTAAEHAVVPIVQELPAKPEGSPGQFAFASGPRVVGILQASGWSSIEVRPVDVACSLPLVKLPAYATRMGPYGLVRDSLDDLVRARADSAALAAFDRYVVRDQVRFTSACWLVTALA